jgi:uncharacterized protein (DUF1330 family)
MPAYFIAIRESIHDPEEMKLYREKAREHVAGLQVRAAYGKVRLLEGEPLEGTVIIEFPTFEAAEAWYDSPGYQQAAVHRMRGAKYRTFITDGLPSLA